jgi:hypothetical protein
LISQSVKRCVRRLLKLALLFFSALALLIAVEIVAGWRCRLQSEIPNPVPRPSDRQAMVAGIKDYARLEDDAYLSLPEWYIVWSYQEKADFQKSNRPSAFPYLGAVRQYWSHYCCISRLTRGKYAFNFGEQVMLVVIGNSFSAEYILKGLYESSVGRFSEWTAGPYPGTEEDAYAYHVARDYADFVHIRPFYEFHFARHVMGLWTENHFWGNHLFRKWERRAFLTLDYSVEAFYCWLIEKATRASYGHEPDQTYAWLDNSDEATLSQIPAVKVVKSPEPRAYIVTIPRYQPFTDKAQAIVARGGHLVEIAGNSSVTVSVLAPSLSMAENRFAQPLYSLPLLTNPGLQRVMFRVDVASLDAALRAWEAGGLVIEHVYDY